MTNLVDITLNYLSRAVFDKTTLYDLITASAFVEFFSFTLLFPETPTQRFLLAKHKC